MNNARADALLTFINNQEPEHIDRFEDPDAPEVVIQGALQLTREQETKMMDFATSRERELCSNLGRDEVVADLNAASLSDLDTFFGRRRLFEMAYEKRWKWRERIPNGIFKESNQHVPVIRRQVQQQIARAQNYFFATSPYFAADPQGFGERSATVSQKVNSYSQWKFRQAKVEAVLKKAVKKALINGEGLVKTTAKRKVSYYDDILSVAIDAEGEPLYAQDGDVIPEDELWDPVIDPETGEPVFHNDGVTPQQVLARDRNTQKPEGGLTYAVAKVTRQRVIYNGPVAENVYYLDFLCPEEAKDVQSTDYIAHLYNMPPIELVQAYIDASTEEDKPRIVDLIRNSANGGQNDTGSAQPGRPANGEFSDNQRSTREGGRAGDIAVAESYIWFDANNDGREENIMLVYDRTTKKPIFYDCVDRLTPKGLRPFFPVRINSIDDQWSGQSQVDLFWDIQMDVDLAHNRRNFSQSQAGTLKCVDWDAVYEGAGSTNMQVNTKKTYRLRNGKTIEDFLQIKNIYDQKFGDFTEVIQFGLQLATTLGGVGNANDNATAGLDTTKLATGVRNIEQSGQEMFAPLISDLQEGLTDAVAQLVRLLGPSMDESEMYEFFDGKKWITEAIQRADLGHSDYTVEMQLTRYKEEQQLTQLLHGLDIVDRYYEQPPQKQEILAPLYKKAVQLFNIDDVDRLIQPGVYFPPGSGGVNPEAAAGALEDPTGGKSPVNL